MQNFGSTALAREADEGREPMQRTLILSASTACLLALVGYVRTVEQRVGRLEREPRADPAEVRGLQGELESVRARVDGADATAAAERERFQRGLATMQRRAEEVARAAWTTRTELARLEAQWAERDDEDRTEALSQEITALRAELDARTTELDALAEGAADLARSEAERLRAEVEPLVGRDPRHMWDELVGPVVQLAGDATVGSGVLLASRQREDGGWLTYLLTSWHVVRDIYGSTDRVHLPVTAKLYDPDGSTRFETAHMVAYDVELDVALLTLDTREHVPHGARLASRERVRSVATFEDIYAVGCPLGNDPIPTPGEIAASSHDVEGGHYWMISAPTYIGNSGGGIFDARTYELLGIFSKIYTHGSTRTTIVPHMGLATPLSVVYEWLDRVDQGQGRRPAGARRPRGRAADGLGRARVALDRRAARAGHSGPSRPPVPSPRRAPGASCSRSPRC